MSVCFKCQKSIPDDSVFCCYCGTKQELTCPDCGVVLPTDSRFCNKCGKALYETAPVDQEAPAVSAPAEPEAVPAAAEQQAPAQPKKRGRKPVEKMPVGNATPGFPNVSGFYANPYANVSPGEEAVVIGMGRWIARVDTQLRKTLFDVDDFGTYESFLASCQNADGIWVATQTGFSYSHMPITLHYLDHNMKWDKSRDKTLLEHGPDLSPGKCVMRDKLFAFCSLDDEQESYYETLCIRRYSIPSGREVVQNISCSAIPYTDGAVLGLRKIEHVLTDGLSLYIKLEYLAESTWINDDGEERTSDDVSTSWLKINLRSSKVENLECENCFFDFDRGLMWRKLSYDEVESIAPDRVQKGQELTEICYRKIGVMSYVAASAIARDAPILVSRLPVLLVSNDTRPLTGDFGDAYFKTFDGNAYFDGQQSYFMEDKHYYVHRLHSEFTCDNKYGNGVVSFTDILLPKVWPKEVLCDYTSEFHSGNYPPVFWQGKLLSCNQNTGILKLGVYPAWWEGEPNKDMLKEI